MGTSSDLAGLAAEDRGEKDQSYTEHRHGAGFGNRINEREGCRIAVGHEPGAGELGKHILVGNTKLRGEVSRPAGLSVVGYAFNNPRCGGLSATRPSTAGVIDEVEQRSRYRTMLADCSRGTALSGRLNTGKDIVD